MDEAKTAATETAEDPAAQVSSQGEGHTPEVHPAEFPEASRTRSKASLPLERFSDVQVEISVEIGRVTMSIGELLQLGQGSVVELDRDLNEPVSVMAQGVRIASGEVVVIDDRFAVRITEITSSDTTLRREGGVLESAS
ncbi:MAG: flagellar motor switch protein FliN [Planctomycetaceae bacterium]